MEIVQRFIQNIAWYQPTTDTDSWRYFYETIYNVDYLIATPETLKNAAWQAQKLQTSEDVGMWADRAARLQKFLSSDITLIDDGAIELEAIQYDFVASFLNDYSAASHNEDLWQSVNASATTVLNDDIVPPTGGDAEGKTKIARDVPTENSAWLNSAIPVILFNAFKTINLSYYRPTTDTDTWAFFQQVMFDLAALPRVQFVYRHTYLLNNIGSLVDAGMWNGVSAQATAFLDANLALVPGNATAQVRFAMNFCDVFQFDYEHAAHNSDLFKAYNDAFATASQNLEPLLAPRHL